MNENLYAEHPAVYDALYAEKDYDTEVEFVLDRVAEQTDVPSDPSDRRALVVGCGTGEHSKRLRDAGVEVVGVDKYEAMIERARTKSDAEFHVGELPELPVEGEFDLVWLPFTVVNHLPGDAVADGLRAAAERLADNGVLVFDQITSASFGDGGPHLGTYETDQGTFARLTHVHDIGDGEQRYDALVFTPDGEFFVDTHLLVDHDPVYLEGVCDVLGLSVERFGWYDEDAEPGEAGHTVFVAG